MPFCREPETVQRRVPERGKYLAWVMSVMLLNPWLETVKRQLCGFGQHDHVQTVGKEKRVREHPLILPSKQDEAFVGHKIVDLPNDHGQDFWVPVEDWEMAMIR